MSKIIELKNVNKWFDKFQALKNINLEVNQQEKIVICGPSGSGKSTLIRCINRLEEHQEGQIVVDGQEISENTKVAVRNIRRDGIEQVKKLEKDKEIGQDDSKKYQENIDKITADQIKSIDEILKNKEEDLKKIEL